LTGKEVRFEISDPVLAARQLARTNIAALLVDSYTGSLPGGTGIAVDLSVIRSIRQNTTLPLILAGGLNPENVAELIKATGPYAVDVLTGVETRPGQKDREKVMRFIQRARKEDYS
jgi:phosphoribosylanthranilate isomerase